MMHKGSWIDERWALNGLQALILENGLVRAVLLPEAGAKLYEFTDKRTDWNPLFQHPRVQPHRPVFGSAEHDRWCGGYDEVIPTVWESRHRGATYPAVGEAWTRPWRYDVTARGSDAVEVHLVGYTVIAPLKIERWVSLHDNEAMLRQRHRVTNLSDEPFDFLWGLHVGFRVNGSARLDLPGGNVYIEPYTSSFFETQPIPHRWPHRQMHDGKTIDMRYLPPQEPLQKQTRYIMLQDGWLAVTDPQHKRGLGMAFPVGAFPVAMNWIIWGLGDLYYLEAQPTTGFPARLQEAATQGICTHLNPGASLECETRLVIYKGVSEVTGIDMEGHVSGIP